MSACAGTRKGPVFRNGVDEHVCEPRHKHDAAWLRALQAQKPTPKTLERGGAVHNNSSTRTTTIQVSVTTKITVRRSPAVSGACTHPPVTRALSPTRRTVLLSLPIPLPVYSRENGSNSPNSWAACLWTGRSPAQRGLDWLGWGRSVKSAKGFETPWRRAARRVSRRGSWPRPMQFVADTRKPKHA